MAFNLQRGVCVGLLAGALWGLAVLIISSFTRLFDFDFGIAYDLPVFLAGGAGFGLLSGAFLEVLKDRLPFRGIIQKSILLSVCIWLLFFGGGMALHFATPVRYHMESIQSLQGFFSSFLLGIILGVLWKKWEDIL